MGDDQNKSDEERFEDGLRQILDGGSSGGRAGAGSLSRPPEGRPESEAREPRAAAKAEEEPKALFWFKLMRPLAFAALLILLVKFVQRITAAQ